MNQRLEQLTAFDSNQNQVLGDVWDAAVEGDWKKASRAVHVALDTAAQQDPAWEDAHQRAVRRLDRVSCGHSRAAAWDVIRAEMLRDQIAAEHHQTLLAPLTFTLDLPSWWVEAGARQLFFEMLENGSGISDAQAAVTALV